MKLLQLNVWQNRLHKQVMKLIEQEQPDLLCLQEICSSDITMPLFPGLAGFEAIQKALPEFESHFAACFRTPMFGTTCAFGNAIFSRYPIHDAHTTFINGEYTEVAMPTKVTTNIRALQRVRVHTPTGELSLMNHHAYWVPNEMGDQTSIEKLTDVAHLAQGVDGPLILAGDLNVVSESPAMAPLHKILTDLTHTHRVPTTLSPIGKFPDIACDHICISPHIRVEKFSVKDEVVSDHLGLVLEFAW